MASANPPLPLPQRFIRSVFLLVPRIQSALKQGIKTGLAGTIAYAIYAGLHLHQGYWAVFAALVVTQANLGASWKAALYRTIGSTCGAIAAALLIPMLGKRTGRSGHRSVPAGDSVRLPRRAALGFTAAGFTAAFILVFGGQGEPGTWRGCACSTRFWAR